jgi:sarcosine oxidase
MTATPKFDVAVIGAGVFGVWTAYLLRQAGAEVAVIDQYGPANSRASSGGESRIIRLGYGPEEIYTRSAQRSFALWHQFFQQTGDRQLFHQTGVLWLAREVDPYCDAMMQILARVGEHFEKLSHDELQTRYPQLDCSGVAYGILEPESGALMARLAVQTLATQLKNDGVTFFQRAIQTPRGHGYLDHVATTTGEKIAAAQFVFACGPWLPKLFPTLLAEFFHITRQEVFFFGIPAGAEQFSDQSLPIWVDFNDLIYAIPSLDYRGFKIAIDAHGPPFDPDTGERIVTLEGLAAVRECLRRRVPALANAPVTESRVCQYENTSNGDFLIDLHPEFENVWLVGGGSGHGFKHGPAVGEYVAAMLSGKAAKEPRYLLSSKERIQQRKVY